MYNLFITTYLFIWLCYSLELNMDLPQAGTGTMQSVSSSQASQEQVRFKRDILITFCLLHIDIQYLILCIQLM